jgi:D-sedoheptulose 7-phosphate isomerase
MNFNSQSYFLENLLRHQQVIAKLKDLAGPLEHAVNFICHALKHDGKVFFCGNGGSAADSQHLAAEFTGRFTLDRKPLAAIALSTDTSALTCISNDYSFDEVFSRQLLALGRPQDCLVGISTSGNSKNVIKAMQVASASGMKTIGLLGKDGGELASLCNVPIIVPDNETARIQEAHILIGHSLCGAVERQLGLV